MKMGLIFAILDTEVRDGYGCGMVCDAYIVLITALCVRLRSDHYVNMAAQCLSANSDRLEATWVCEIRIG